MGAGWRELDLPGVVQEQARLGQTSGRLSPEVPPCTGASPPPFP